MHRIEVAEDGHQHLECLAGILGGEGIRNALQAAACRQVVVDRFEQRVAIAELRVDGHPRDPGALGNRLQREAVAADQLLTRCGDDPLAALAHRRGAALQLVRPRLIVATFTVLSVQSFADGS